ncbi:hypothetical protein [Streptomyces gobiensis]|uniref:hypothetical protein n=1 Tax=Streptomyces gobiensis TaxID=2875706 RepID=UPI001E2FC3CB|nr:hypothetical protein [Streptomyces gobiensis]UGY92380.1 hypothetical protein test1122_12020 [Streptomyces gobiensis]
MMTTKRAEAAERIRSAEDATSELRDALAGVGITLPSLRIDPVTCAREVPAPLVDLGCCNIETARRLAAVIKGCKR